jgi:hypothetical protein
MAFIGTSSERGVKMPNKIVDANNERNERIEKQIDKGMAVAAIVQAIPVFVWAAPFVLLFGFIVLALWFHHDGLSAFTCNVLLWLSRLLIGAGVCLLLAGAWKCYKLYHDFMLDAAARRTVRAGATKAIAAARNAELKNELLEADILLRQQIPNVILALTQTGVAFKYDAKGTLEVLGQPGRVNVNQIGGAAGQEQIGVGAGAVGLLGPGEGLPTNVLYEEVRGQVPTGHILVGIGQAGIETVEKAVGALVWIVGLSGTGKTSTTVLRVEERAALGHKFLGVDPHFFKDDSLTNAIKGYVSRFLKPMARTPEETKEVLQYFLDEFYGRKNGSIPKPWQPITLLVDEVGALMDAIDALDKEIADMLKRIARICGQEARNFEMGGIMISQQATGLAWLRKVALMVIVHQLLMQSEKELACNGDKAVMKDMEYWPRGRTYVYGVGFGSGGARTVQQPFFKSPDGDSSVLDDRSTDNSSVVDAVVEDEQEQEEKGDSPSPVPALSGDLRCVYDAVQQLVFSRQKVTAREIEALTGFGKDKANSLLNRLADLGYIQRPGRKAV